MSKGDLTADMGAELELSIDKGTPVPDLQKGGSLPQKYETPLKMTPILMTPTNKNKDGQD